MILFSAPNYYSFQFSPIRPDKKPKTVVKEKDNDIVETLLLTPFSQIPKLFFDNVKIGDTAKQKLLIKNNTSHDITVSTCYLET